MSESVNILMRTGNSVGNYGGGDSWSGNQQHLGMPETNGHNPIRAAVVAVLHFFGNQMTSPRGQEAMLEGSTVQRSDGYHDAPVQYMGNGWVEAGRAA